MCSRYEIRVEQLGDMVHVFPLGFAMINGREIADPGDLLPKGFGLFYHPEENNAGYWILHPTEKKIKEAVSKLEVRLRKKIGRELKVWRSLNPGKTPPEIPIVICDKTRRD